VNNETIAIILFGAAVLLVDRLIARPGFDRVDRQSPAGGAVSGTLLLLFLFAAVMAACILSALLAGVPLEEMK
jgi:hypothetical protein